MEYVHMGYLEPHLYLLDFKKKTVREYETHELLQGPCQVPFAHGICPRLRIPSKWDLFALHKISFTKNVSRFIHGLDDLS